MTLKFPDLAVRTYKDILDEMVSSIPRYTEKWTNFNPADPGITILEILAWIFETNLYMINRMPEETYINFIRLIAGARGDEVKLLLDKLRKDPNSDRYHMELLSFLKEIEEKKNTGQPIKDIFGMKAAAFQFLNSDYRAITEENFAALAIEATRNRREKEPKVKRAIVKGILDGKVEIIIISDRQEKYDELKKIVKDYLEPRRLICTKIVVKEPVYSSLKIQIDATLLPHAIPGSSGMIKQNILGFLDPVTGGDDKNGWPYGRQVSIYELFHIIEETQGVDHVNNITFDNDPALRNKKIEGLVGKVDISIEVKMGDHR